MKRLHSIIATCLFLAVPPLSFVACGGGLDGLCSDVCNCEGCSDKEEQECEDNAAKVTEQAADKGCEDELDALVECMENAFKCDNENAQFTDDCADENEDLAKCGIPGVTLGNLCERAAEICGGGGGDGEQVECSGQVECVARCIVDNNSCDVGAPDSPLQSCINNCVGSTPDF